METFKFVSGCYLSIAIFLVFQMQETLQNPDEDRLLRDLFKDYNKDVRPVVNMSQAVQVTFGITFSQIIDVDEKNQILTSNIWVRQVWYNPLLTWNSSLYAEVDTVNVDPKKVWLPDLVLYNNADDMFGGGMDKFEMRVVLKSNGRNMWLAPHIFKSSCKIDVKYFPFDEQRCPMKFGSWTYDGFRLDLHNVKDAADLDKYVSSGEWDLIAIPAKRNEIYYPCCPEHYPDITYTVIIRRRTLFYFINLIIPCLLITALTILSFYLPPESGERVTLVITILLAMTVFLLLVAESMPPTSEVVPLIGIYYTAAMFEISLSLVATCLTLKLYYRHPASPDMSPLFRKFVFGFLARLLCVTMGNKIYDSNASTEEVLVNARSTAFDFESGQMKELTFSEGKVLTNGNGIALNELGSPSKLRSRHTTLSSCSKLSQASERVVEGISIMANRVCKQERVQAVQEEWQIAAMIIDKFFFWLFIIIIVVSTVAIFLSAPRWYK